MASSKAGLGNSFSRDKFVINISDDDIAALKASGDFDASWYLNEYPDVALVGLEPELHYLWIGKRLGRRPSAGSAMESAESTQTAGDRSAILVTPPALEKSAVALAAKIAKKASAPFRRRRNGISAAVLEVVEKNFDIDYYLSNYPDIAEAGVDPIEHYLQIGWQEGRNPSLTFSTRFYTDNNPDVVAEGVNPFYHYLVAGKAEGRLGRHELGFRWDVLASLKTVADQIAEYKSHRVPVVSSSRTLLQSKLELALAKYPSKLVLSFSHDDYTGHVGGVQLLLRRELELLRAHGYLQIHFYPVHPLPFLDTSGDPVQLGVLLDGTLVGVFDPQDINACLAGAEITAHKVQFVIHNLLGHNMDQALTILSSTGAKEGFFWIHDFAALYNNYKLLRNDVEYSGVPRPGTPAWDLCEFARANFSHRAEFAKLFRTFSVDLLSPSASALAIWQESGVHVPRSSHVVPHVAFQEIDTAQEESEEGPLRVGFIGYPVDHKGWSVFEELVLKLAGDPRYEFHHLGSGRRGGLPVIYHKVVSNQKEPDLMRKATAATRLDVALIWSIWPETFCLTAYEAFAGGAAIVTNPSAGNVVDMVNSIGDGVVLKDEAALFAAFESGEILKFARARRRAQQYSLEYSALTLGLMEDHA